jgi:hypothetical protein
MRHCKNCDAFKIEGVILHEEKCVGGVVARILALLYTRMGIISR